MSSDFLKSNCECCGTSTPIDNLHIVCPDCYNTINHVKNTKDLFKCNWEDQEEPNNENNS